MTMVPLIASAADVPGAIEFAQNHPAARWYVARGAVRFDQGDTVPAEWGEAIDAIVAAGRRPKLGTGARFKALKGKLAARGVNDPGALAAYIGRQKYGPAKMGKLAAKGRTAAAVTADAGTVTDDRTQQLGMPSAGWLRRVRAEINAAGLDPDVVEAQLGGGFSSAYDGTDAVAYAETLLDQVITDLADEFPELAAEAQEIAATTDPDADPATTGDDEADDDEDADPEPVPAEAAAPAGKIDPSAPAPAPVAPVAASGWPYTTTAGAPLVWINGAPATPAPAPPVADTEALLASVRQVVNEELAAVLAAGAQPGLLDDDEDPDAMLDPTAMAAEAPNGLDPDGDGDVDIPGSPLDTDDDAAALQGLDTPDAADVPPVGPDDGTAPDDTAAGPPVDLEAAKAKLRARFGGKAKAKAPVAASASRPLTASAMRARLAERATG